MLFQCYSDVIYSYAIPMLFQCYSNVISQCCPNVIPIIGNQSNVVPMLFQCYSDDISMLFHNVVPMLFQCYSPLLFHNVVPILNRYLLFRKSYVRRSFPQGCPDAMLLPHRCDALASTGATLFPFFQSLEICSIFASPAKPGRIVWPQVLQISICISQTEKFSSYTLILYFSPIQ